MINGQILKGFPKMDQPCSRGSTYNDLRACVPGPYSNCCNVLTANGLRALTSGAEVVEVFFESGLRFLFGFEECDDKEKTE